MLNNMQIKAISSIFNAREIKDYVESNIYDYMLFENKESNPNCNVAIRIGFFGTLSLLGGVR